MTMTLKLTYFNIRGLAETARILFAIGGEEYEDFRYPLEIIDMSKYEMNKEEFEKDKAEGKLVHSLNKLPFHFQLFHAIHHLLCQKHHNL